VRIRTYIVAGAALSGLLAPPIAPTQWARTHGPDGGRVESLVSIDTVLYCCSGGSLCRSTDNGLYWSIQDSDLRWDVSFLHAQGSLLFAGLRTGGLFLSSDQGMSWVAAGDGLPDAPVSDLLVREDTLMAVMHFTDIFRSFDRGMHWTEAGSGVVKPAWSAYYIFRLNSKGRHIFAGTYFGVYHSTDWGSTWTPANQGLADSNVSALAFKDTLLFAGTSNHGPFVSSDFGSSWWPASISPLAQYAVSSFAVSGDSIYAGTNGHGVFVSSDNGLNWSAIGNGLSTLSSRFIAGLLSTRRGLFARTYGGLFRSTDGGGSWLSANVGLSNSAVYALFDTPSGIYAGTWHMGVFLSSDHGETWQPMSKGITDATVDQDVYAFAEQGRFLFAGTYNDAFRSSDQGASWIELGVCTGPVGAFTVIDSTIFAAYSGLSYSTDSGATWVATYNGLTDGIWSLSTRGNTLIAGSDWSGIYRSTDLGQSWALGSGSRLLETECLLTVDSMLYAGTHNSGIYYSTDDGMSWSPIPRNPENPSIYCLAAAKGMIFAGTGHGVYASTDWGQSWRDVTTPGIENGIYSLRAIGSDLYAGTDARGVWRRPLSEMMTSVDLATGNSPHEFQLLQNYPNPFNPTTKISYSLSRAGSVQLLIFNVLGQRVATLIDQVQENGEHTITWDASRLGSGTYFIQLRSSGGSRVRRALMIR
jgi:photosystem II stability/assembly factor-like uncharacterized protein